MVAVNSNLFEANMSADAPVFSKVLDTLKDHPLFSGHHSVGIMAGENPKVPPALPGGNRALHQLLKEQGLPYEETEGRYGEPEASTIIHGPTRDQMFNLGRALGQESVVFSNRGQHELIFTTGENAGKYRPSHPHYSFDPETPFPDYWTKIPGKGYLRLYFDSNRLLPAPLQQNETPPPPVDAQQNVTRQDVKKGLAKALRSALEKFGRVR